MLQWGWPGLSRKAHVFSDLRSLCGKWLFRPQLGEPEIASAPARGPDDCAACHKKLVARFRAPKIDGPPRT